MRLYTYISPRSMALHRTRRIRRFLNRTTYDTTREIRNIARSPRGVQTRLGLYRLNNITASCICTYRLCMHNREGLSDENPRDFSRVCNHTDAATKHLDVYFYPCDSLSMLQCDICIICVYCVNECPRSSFNDNESYESLCDDY